MSALPHLAHLSTEERQRIAAACEHDRDHAVLMPVPAAVRLQAGDVMHVHWVGEYCPRCGLLLDVTLARPEGAVIFAEARA